MELHFVDSVWGCIIALIKGLPLASHFHLAHSQSSWHCCETCKLWLTSTLSNPALTDLPIWSQSNINFCLGRLYLHVFPLVFLWLTKVYCVPSISRPNKCHHISKDAWIFFFKIGSTLVTVKYRSLLPWTCVCMFSMVCRLPSLWVVCYISNIPCTA